MKWTLKYQQPHGESTNTSHLIILITFLTLLGEVAYAVSGRKAVCLAIVHPGEQRHRVTSLLLTLEINMFRGEYYCLVSVTVCNLVKVNVYQPTRRHIPEDSTLHSDRRDNLRPHIFRRVRPTHYYLHCTVFDIRWQFSENPLLQSLLDYAAPGAYWEDYTLHRRVREVA
jgi:hypothetical protein